MPAAKKASRGPVAGRDDAQVFLLKCPKCERVLEVVNYRTGPLDHIRGVHRIVRYGWFARCLECDEQWGGEAQSEPSMWVLKDSIEEAKRATGS